MERLPVQKKGFKSGTDRKIEAEAEKKAKGPARKPAYIEKLDGGLLDVTLSLNHFYSPMDEKVLVRAMLAQEGVSECSANYRSGEVRFVLDPEKNSIEKLEEVCSGLSYPPGEGLDGFWLDVACAIAILLLYIFIPKGLERFGVNESTLRAVADSMGIGMTLIGAMIAVIGLKLWGIPVFQKLNIKIGEEIPNHYNKYLWKAGIVLLVLIGLLIIGYGLSAF